MPSNNNIKPTTKLSKGFQLIAEFYKEPTQKLIKHLQEKHNYSLQDCADIIGFSKQAIQTNWLKPVQEDKNNG